MYRPATALLAALALTSAAPAISAQSGPPEWNRRMVGVEVVPTIPGVPGRYDVKASVHLSRNDPSTSPLDLSFLVLVLLNGDPNPVATNLTSVLFNPPSASCSVDACVNNWLCASLNVDGIPLLGVCRVFPPHPGDDAPWCGCSGVANIPAAQQIPLDPGDELMILIVPDVGAVPEPYQLDDGWLTTVPGDGITSLCFGDEHAGACPCGNPGFPGQGCGNSTGAGAVLTTFGSASIAADDLWFRGQNLPPFQPVLLFYGHDVLNGGSGIPFGDGLRCVGTATVRMGTEIANSSGFATWGPGLAAHFGWLPGEVIYVQDWYRDNAGPCNSGFNLSNALRVEFSP